MKIEMTVAEATNLKNTMLTLTDGETPNVGKAMDVTIKPGQDLVVVEINPNLVQELSTEYSGFFGSFIRLVKSAINLGEVFGNNLMGILNKYK